MILIIGLGNPGLKFKNTRHNIGFEILDQIRKNGDFSVWENKKRLKAKICVGEHGDKKLILAKPQTFMNNSGESLKLLTAFYKIPISELWVVHDDIDLEFGKIRIKNDSGSGGHKGIESIISCLGTKDFKQFKIGILNKKKGKIDTKKFVLQKFTKQELGQLKDIKQESILSLFSAL
ncbi:aminoacyl-tRNA hydrolase [Patescibacteria group bacterium]|nr:aminoacyl-tRNA hydrolase [Patescibacteria group bacterium]MBU4162328.1 aminoacyl-tRNA hydrolase [Patescibacteria group bacterium]